MAVNNTTIDLINDTTTVDENSTSNAFNLFANDSGAISAPVIALHDINNNKIKDYDYESFNTWMYDYMFDEVDSVYSSEAGYDTSVAQDGTSPYKKFTDGDGVTWVRDERYDLGYDSDGQSVDEIYKDGVLVYKEEASFDPGTVGASGVDPDFYSYGYEWSNTGYTVTHYNVGGSGQNDVVTGVNTVINLADLPSELTLPQSVIDDLTNNPDTTRLYKAVETGSQHSETDTVTNMNVTSYYVAYKGDEDATIWINYGSGSMTINGQDVTLVSSGVAVIMNSDPANGTVEFDEETSAYNYTPNTDYSGSDSFTYTVSVVGSGVDTATVNVTVNAAPVVNTAPVAVSTMGDMVAYVGDVNPTIDPSSYFSDADSDALTYSITTERVDGSELETESLSDWHNAAGTLSANDVGTWVTTITANDGNGGTATQTFNIMVNSNPSNTTPVAADTYVAPFDAEQDYARDAVQDLFNKMGITTSDLSVVMTEDESTDINTFTISSTETGMTILVFNADGTLNVNSSSNIPTSMSVDDIEKWYEFSDPENNDSYALKAVEDLFEQIGINDFTNLNATVQPTETGDFMVIEADSLNYNGVEMIAVRMEFVFVDGLLSSKTGVPTELSSIFSDANVNTWYTYNGPDKQREQEQQDAGFVSDDHQESYSNVWTWTDGEGVSWIVVDQDNNGVWTSTETGSNGDVRTFAGNWDQSTQENTFIETFTNSDSSIDFTRTEVSGNNGTTITYTGKVDHIGWQPLDGIYTIDPSNPIIETLDFMWNTTGITGQATKEGEASSVAVDFVDGQITVGGEAVYTDFGFDDFFKAGEVNSYEWTDWDGSVWKTIEEDVAGIWTTTETKYDSTGTTPTGEERVMSSSWDNNSQTNTWTEQWTDDNGTTTKTEVSTPTGTTITTTGTSDHVGWMNLGELYTNLNVVETMDSNWNTTNITGSGDNASGISVDFTWDASNWQLLIDGDSINVYDDASTGGDYQQAQDWTSESWTWTDGNGTTWTVTDKQEGDVWTSTQIATNGDSRISRSEWNQDTETNTWSEAVVESSRGLDFTVTEINNKNGESTSATVGNTDRIGWMPLDGVYTDVNVIETRDANWQTVSVVGSGFNTDGVSVTFGMEASDWGFQITIDDGTGAIAYDPWASDNVHIDNATGVETMVKEDYSNTFTWQDWDGSTWTVVDEDVDGVWTSTETNGTTGDVRVHTSSWDDTTNTSTWSEKFTSGDGKVDFTRTETYNQDGSSSITTTGKDDHIGWDYLGEVYTDMDVTLVRDTGWNIVSITGVGTNTDGDVVKFDYDDGQITVDGDTIGQQDYGDDTKSADNFEYEWSYYDDMGVEWTVTDSQDGDWWESKEVSSNGDVRVNKSMWNELGDDDNGDGTIDAGAGGGDKGAYSKFVSKYKSSETDGSGDPLIKYKMVEKYYNDYEGSGDSRSVMIVKGTTDQLGWDYLGEVYSDIDFKIVRNNDGSIRKIAADEKDAQGNDVVASAVNESGTPVYFHKNNGEIFITEDLTLADKGRSIYQMNDNFFDFDDQGGNEFEMETGQWEFDYQNQQGQTVSVVDKNTATDIITITADSYNAGSESLKIAIIYDLDSDNISSIVGVPDGVAGLDTASIETWYKTTVLNFEPNGGWDSADADAQEQAFITQATSDYFGTISLNTVNLATVFDINDKWVTTEITKDQSNNVVSIVVRGRSESIGTESEREEFYETDSASTAQAKFDAGTPSKWVEKSMTFEDNTDGGYSMVQAITSSQGEDMTRTETYNEDGTITITNIGDIWFEGMLVRNAEIIEQLDHNWNLIDFSGTSEIPDAEMANINSMANQIIEGYSGPANANVVTVDNTKVMISFDGVGEYGQPQLTFSIFATEDITFNGITIFSKDEIFAEENNYDKAGDSTLNEYILADGDSYSTSRKDWVWNQDSLNKTSETIDNTDAENEITTVISTFIGTQSDKPEHTITIVETKKINEDGSINWLDHQITTTKNEDYTINFKVIDGSNTDYDHREGVELEFVGAKKYSGELYKDVSVFEFIDKHSDDVSINGTAKGLDGSDVEIFKPEGQRKLEILKIGRDGQQQKIVEDDGQDYQDGDHQFIERDSEVYQWSYTDQNSIDWTVVDKYEADTGTWSSTETSSVGERSFVDTWGETGGMSVFTEKLNGEDVRIETRVFTSEYNTATNEFKDIQVVTITKGSVTVGSFTETMTFNNDGTSTRTIDGSLYHFNGQNYTDILVIEQRDSSWNITSLTGSATPEGSTLSVDIGYSDTNSWGEPILTFDNVIDVDGITNTNPDAVADSFTTDENTTLTLDVLANDTDTDGDDKSISSVGKAAHGKTFLLDGEVVYTPDHNYSGDDEFTYTVNDGKGGEDTATVTIDITAVNEDVNAIDDSFTVEAGSLATILDLTSNDTDADGDTMTVTAVTSATNGTVSLDLGVVTYKPDADYDGTDSFTYTVSDGTVTDTATATVVVEALNAAPTTTEDVVTLNEDASIQIDVLLNDTDDADTTSLVIDSVGEATNGTVKLVNGYVFYTPDADYAGADSFTYVAKDSEGAKTPGSVTLTVSARNDAPVATVDVVNIEQDSSALTIDVLANDIDAESDTLSLIKVGTADHGTVTMANGQVTYTPDADYAGVDSFTYTVGDLDTDGTTIKAKTIGTVSITVSELNIDPITVDDIQTVTEDSTNNKFSVLTNDTDSNGDTLALDSVSSATYGTATLAGNNILYDPDADYEGSETLTYTVSDGNGGTTTGTVTITVRGQNDAPVAVADILGSISTDKGPVKLDVLANDYDIDVDDSISIKSVATSETDTFASTAVTALGNRVSIASDKVTYTASSVTSGSDSFSYQIMDADGLTHTANTTLTLSSNTNPDALNDTQTIAEDASATEITVLSNDTDVDSDKVQIFKISTDPSNGKVAVENGKIFYTPDANYVGTDSFTYIVKDGRSGFDEATATITITAINDDPSAKTDNISVETGASAAIMDILGNDIDVDGDTLTVTDVNDALKGGTVVLTDGVVTYAPKAGFTGTDSFTYTVSDGTATATATANITVTAINIAPVVVDDVITSSILEDSRDAQIDVLSNDTDADVSDTLSVVAITQAEHGTVKLTAGKVFYAPDADYNGSDSFTYTIDDGNGAQDSGVVTLTVTNVDDIAEASNDDLGDIALGARRVKVDLLSNDSDIDGDAVSITGVENAKYGSVSLVNGEVYYTPGNNEGVDVFTYTITGGATGTAKVNVVAANNDATGSVSISGAAQTGQTLTASNTLADEDGMTGSTVTYQWYRDGTILDAETSTTYEIALEEAGSTFSVKATYTDDNGTIETVSSSATDVVTQLDTPFTFVSTVVTGVDANAALSGYSFADTDELVKLTLNLDANSIYSRTDIDSITGADLSLNIDWTQFDALDGASAEKFAINKVGSNLLILNSSSTSNSNTFDTLALASLRTIDPMLTIVDTDTTSADASKLSNSADLIEVYLRPNADAGKVAIELSGTISANQGQVTFAQYDSTMSNITEISENSTPTGDVTISGVVAVDEMLTASHTLADEDGMGVVSYQWLRDGTEISGAVNNTYTITTSDINKAISVKASYTDVDSTAESKVSSASTVIQSTENKPLMFTSGLITAEQASIEKYGADYSSDAAEVIIKLTLSADMARFATDSTIASITGTELDLAIDWSLFEDIAYSDNTTAKYEISKDYTGSLFMGDVTNASGELTKLVATSLNTSTKPLLTLVDNVDSTGRGVVDQPSSVDLLSIYLNPKDTVKDFEVVYGGDISVDQGDSTFVQLSHSLEVEAKTYDAIVSTASTATTITSLTGVSINLWENGVDTTSSVAVDTGEVSIDSTVIFDEVKLSVVDAYDFDINISDAIDVLRHIVDLEAFTPGSAGFHAADVDNNGSINISDAIDILRHIVDLEAIDTFDIINASGNRVTTLDANASGDAPTWTIVANGDVDLSGDFSQDYLTTIEML